MAQMADIIRRSRRDTAHERVQLVSGSERELQQRLRRAQIDVALTILHPDSDNAAGELLFTERYAIALPRFHPLAARKTIPAEALGDNTMIVRRHCEALSEISKHFTERGVRPFFAYRSTNDEQVLALVQAGLGVTVMPESYRAPGVVRPYLAGFEQTRRIGLLFAPHAERLGRDTSPLLNAIRARYVRTTGSLAGKAGRRIKARAVAEGGNHRVADASSVRAPTISAGKGRPAAA
jgi:DNA-binding transcriptional LysR family regulator